MNVLRIICVQVDAGYAIHIGGPPVITRKTFDIPAPQELVRWLEHTKDSYCHQSIEGCELIVIDPVNESAEVRVK